jgi:hypothetical protein
MPTASGYHPVNLNSWRSRSKKRYEALQGRRSTTGGTGGITVKNARTATILAVALAFVAMWVVLAAGATAMWLTGDGRVFGLVALPTAIVAALLVVYFDWREKLRRRMLDEPKDYQKAA